MRKICLFFLVLLTVSTTMLAGVHRCGTLNIRVIYSDDKGEKAWDNRKEALVSAIRDSIDYDMVGLNEVTSTQLTYLKSQLDSIYTFVQRSGATNNQVLYRTSKYNCLASGFFYLAPDPTRAGKAWDAQETRWAVWTRLQDKVSGEIIVFASTHLDLYPISKREGARVAAEQINKVAGDYACVITGDLNIEMNEHDPHANLNKFLGSARKWCKTEPQGPYGTYIPGMNPQTLDAKLLDYLYVRNVEVESYRVFNSLMPGRTMAISDHRPVVCEIKILSPDREFVHTVKTVNELRQVARDIQPNDIIYLKDGTYDLADTALSIANTCVIEGSKNAVLTGATQLMALPDYISLELSGITIKDASCNMGALGSIVNIHGAYLKMTDCTIENCSTQGEGLLYVNDCEATLEKCQFRNNRNENMNAGLQMVSSLGVDRYPLTMKKCLFDGNYSYYAPAVYYTSEATAYLRDNSFVHNRADYQGTISICGANTKDIRLVNNTFVDNRIDVEAGFLSSGIGGSAIWQEQAASGILTLMNNTIVGNYTACWDEPGVSSTDFMGGAVCCYAGKLALYNNVLAGNYCSKSGSEDVTMGESGESKASKNNLLSDYATACVEMPKLYGGSVEQGVYQPQLQYIGDNPLPVLSPFVTKYAGNNIAVLDQDDMSASQVGSDIMNIGSNMGFLTIDQIGTLRNTYTVPGSMEAQQVEPAGIINVNANVNANHKMIMNGQIIIQHNNKQYNIIGNTL